MDLQEVEHTRFLCSRADHNTYMYIYIKYTSMTAHKLLKKISSLPSYPLYLDYVQVNRDFLRPFPRHTT